MNRRNFIGGLFAAAAAVPVAAFGAKSAEHDDGSSVVKNCDVGANGILYIRGPKAVVRNVRMGFVAMAPPQ